MIPYCQHQIQDADREAVSKVLDSDRLTQGPTVGVFEAALSRATGAGHAIAVSSGTSALQVALLALRLSPGDEVLVPSLTFLATVNAVVLAGGIPRFVDVDPDTLAVDPAELERRRGPTTRGAIVVHYAGHVADLSACREALGDGRFLVEDACHALGAKAGGRPVGVGGDAACFSFHPAKHVTTGEGGAITTDRTGLAARCRALREHGMVRRLDGAEQGLGLPTALSAEQSGGWVYEMQSLSGNHRLSDLAASLGASQLERLPEVLEARRRLAARYDRALAAHPLVETLAERPGTRSAWHLYPVRLDVDRIEGGRAAVYHDLHAAGIGVQVHYIPVHLQPWYRDRFGTRFGDLPRTEAAYLRLLSLPLFPQLGEDDQDRVLEALFASLTRRAR